MTAIFATRSLSCAFGGLKAVDDVSIHLAEGEICALIGPNGAGKTTLFNLLSGALRPTSGTVHFREREITRLPPHQLSRIGIGRTFQIAATFNSMTVQENIETALRAANRNTSDWQSAADAAGIAQLSSDLVPSLSYGDVKRVELAMALAQEPALLLLDEPTAGVAEDERLKIMHTVVELARASGTTVLFTEHDMAAVFGFAERVMVMDQGAIIADGTPDAIRNDPRVQAVYLGDGSTGHA